MSTGIKPLDQAYLTSIFDRLGKLEVHLDSDPLVYGPKRLNLKTALVRKMLTDCERVFLQISQDQANYKRQHRAAKVILDVQLKHLLANDPNVRAGRAVSEREAIAFGVLKDEVQEVNDAENAIEELDAVMQVVKAKRSDLRDIQGRLRDQVRLCQEEIGLGSRWGSKSPRGVELQPGQGFADGEDVAKIDAVIQQVRDISDAERHLPAAVDTSPDSTDEELDALIVGLGGDDDDSDTVPARSAVTAKPLELFGSQYGVDPNVRKAEPIPVPDLDTYEDVPGVDSAPRAAAVAPPEVATGAALAAKFGYVPHCADCGEVQTDTTSGMTCPNGHGGADTVRPAEDVLDGAEDLVTALPPTADPDEVAEFLGMPGGPATGPKKSRFQVEEEDGMDLDSILLAFES